MTEPYPHELRGFGGEVVDEGVQAPGVPVDPEADAEQGGIGTGDLGSAAPPSDLPGGDDTTRPRDDQE